MGMTSIGRRNTKQELSYVDEPRVGDEAAGRVRVIERNAV